MQNVQISKKSFCIIRLKLSTHYYWKLHKSCGLTNLNYFTYLFFFVMKRLYIYSTFCIQHFNLLSSTMLLLFL